MAPETLLQREFSLRPEQVKNIVALIDAGNTIPFIARYRKEMTGSCDDQVLRKLSDRLRYLRGLEERRREVREGVLALGKLTAELDAAISAAQTLAVLEDLYRPFGQKRKTRASVAKERGLAPLAALLLAQDRQTGSAEQMAAPFVNAQKGVMNWEDACAGACDILAEKMAEDAGLRAVLRETAARHGSLVSRGDKSKPSVYEAYYDYAEPVAKIPGHRILALDRGEKEGFLKISLGLADEAAYAKISARYLKGESVTTPLVRLAIKDAWKRLLKPALERETRASLTGRAAEAAIQVFALNMKPLLLTPPVRGKTVMAVDPAYRTGCKIAVVDQTGRLLAHTVVYPTPPQRKTQEAARVLTELIDKYKVEMIAIGNGTASKETEVFVAGLAGAYPGNVSYTMVNEAGASVYSASPLGAEEFPELDVSYRSAVSIARRLQDPLAELVKIDPKSIGVGQYQHDMPPARLNEVLSGVVEDCVNSVGADLNTASVSLLKYIAGLNAATAKNIVAYRDQNGSFQRRSELKKVPRLGEKAFLQCAGFLRIAEGPEPLDNTAVHPESYAAAKKLLQWTGGGRDALAEAAKNGAEGLAKRCGVGVPTLRDIAAELLKPGRDIRDELPRPELRGDIMEIKDLKAGMEFTGTVRNVTDFGAFVDIGVHQDGLVHISQMADRFLKHPSEAVRVGDIVKVRVLSADPAKNRISLTMKRG